MQNEDEDDYIDDEDEMEEEEEDEIPEEKAPQRRSRRLVLDDEEEEEPEREERRYATRRSENRNVSGRRNRNLVSDTLNVREATSLFNRSLRGSTRQRPQNMVEELNDDLECTRCGYVLFL